MIYLQQLHWQGFAKRVLVIVFGLLTLAACTTVNQKVGEVLSLDTDLKLEITATDSVNPDEKDQASPVFIQLYELNGTTAFENADFIDLFENDAKTLGDTLVAKQELNPVVPGTTRTEQFVLSKGTRYVALFAQFYRYKNSEAKIVFPVTSSNVVRNSIKITVSGNKISLQK